MKTAAPTRRVRCAIYTRKDTEEGLSQSFNSLDAQRGACEAYIASQAGEGWKALADRYDDGGYSAGSMGRPALSELPAVRQGARPLDALRRISRANIGPKRFHQYRTVS